MKHFLACTVLFMILLTGCPPTESPKTGQTVSTPEGEMVLPTPFATISTKGIHEFDDEYPSIADIFLYHKYQPRWMEVRGDLYVDQRPDLSLSLRIGGDVVATQELSQRKGNAPYAILLRTGKNLQPLGTAMHFDLHGNLRSGEPARLIIHSISADLGVLQPSLDCGVVLRREASQPPRTD